MKFLGFVLVATEMLVVLNVVSVLLALLYKKRIMVTNFAAVLSDKLLNLLPFFFCLLLTYIVSESKDANKQLTRQRSKSLIMRRKDKKLSEESIAHAEENPPRVAPLAPQLLHIPSSSPVVQVACGLHHTVVLTLAGEVFTFGSNQFGQLGTGDMQPISGPIRVNVTGNVCQVAAGSNHTVLLTYKGLIYTFGNYQKGQLGRLPHDFQNKTSSLNERERSSIRLESMGVNETSTESSTVTQMLAQRQKILWHCTPGLVL